MNEAEPYAEAILTHITEPLSRVAGRQLRQVLYYVLQGEFDAEAPNDSGGCQGIRLIFDEGEAEFNWDNAGALRVEGIYYHLTIRDQSLRQEAIETVNVGGGILQYIDATQTAIWRDLIGKRLDGFAAMGLVMTNSTISPQAIILHFANEIVIIAVGMTPGTPSTLLSIGDGDEVLVFSEMQWQELPSPEHLIMLT